MRVFCECEESHPDLYCHLCGQGFVLHWEVLKPEEVGAAIRAIHNTLRLHHVGVHGRYAHPRYGFTVTSQPMLMPMEAESHTGTVVVQAA